YLEHGEIGLVRESLRERERLICELPHLVKPMQFLLALPRDHNPLHLRSAMAVRAGLWFYGKMVPGVRCAHMEKRDDFDRALEESDQWSFFDYEDAQCEFPERLVAEWLSEATTAGAT